MLGCHFANLLTYFALVYGVPAIKVEQKVAVDMGQSIGIH